MRRRLLWMAALAAALLPGACASSSTASLPRYDWIDSEHALAELAARANAIRTLSATGELRLHRSDGERVRLESVLVGEPPDRMRLRTFKMSQTVFDILATPDGVWAYAPDADDPAEALAEADVRADRIIEGLALLSGAVFEGAVIVELGDDALVLNRDAGSSGARIRAVVDRNTLAPLAYTLLDAAGGTRFRLSLDGHRMFGPHLLATRVTGDGESGSFELRLKDIAINATLPDAAFERTAASVRVAPPEEGP